MQVGLVFVAAVTDGHPLTGLEPAGCCCCPVSELECGFGLVYAHLPGACFRLGLVSAVGC